MAVARTLLLLAVPALATFLGGCNQSEFEDVRGDAVVDDDDAPDEPDGPGSAGRVDTDVACSTEDDCGPGETCLDQVCQMQRCAEGAYSSAAPLAANVRFAQDREFVVADAEPSDGRFFVDGYTPLSGSVEYPGSWDIGSTAVVDVAGGDFFGANPELFAISTAGSTRVRVAGIEEVIEVDVGFQPLALAAGDTDGDERDEVFVLGQFGNYALCDMVDGECTTGFFQGGSGVDASIGDVDGDGQLEGVLLLEAEGSTMLHVLEFTGEQDGSEGPAAHPLSAIEVGDPDGDGVDEVFGIEPSDIFADAQLHRYTAMGGSIGLVASDAIHDDSVDLAFGDLDADDSDELLILRNTREVELFRESEDNAGLSAESTHLLDDSNAPRRIAAVDFDGDSPRTRLMSAEPVLVAGRVLPVSVGLFPPYNSEFSDGQSSVTFGQAESTSESFSDSVSLQLGVDFGVSIGLFDIAKLGLGTKIKSKVSQTETQSSRKSAGVRYTAAPETYFEGEPYGVVTLSCGCFHAYTYQVEDPSEILGEGGDKEEFVLLVPVGGAQMLWSTPRYNAMAEAVGDLPVIDVPYEVGNPNSYPRAPERLDGSPIPADDFVFTEPPSLLVSDAGSSGFRMMVGQDTSNSVSRSTSIGLSVDVSGDIPFLGGVKFGTSLGVGWGEGYSVRVGDSAFFGGKLPPLPDNPDTPEDEYLDHAYTTLPFVYREHYTDATGQDAAYYVISYAVSDD
ncbi:MAG: hypothetical protein ACRBN8_39815 [Nannocystales bacterium]